MKYWALKHKKTGKYFFEIFKTRQDLNDAMDYRFPWIRNDGYTPVQVEITEVIKK